LEPMVEVALLWVVRPELQAPMLLEEPAGEAMLEAAAVLPNLEAVVAEDLETRALRTLLMLQFKVAVAAVVEVV